MFKELKKFFAKGKFKEDDLKKVEANIFAANRKSLIAFATFSAAACFTGTMGGLFSNIETMQKSLAAYIIVLLLNIFVIIASYRSKVEQRESQHYLVSIFVIPLYVLSLYQAIFVSPNDRPLILVVFLCLIPTIFIGMPIRLFLDFLFTSIVYIVVAPFFVHSGNLSISIADILIFGLAGVCIGLFFNRTRTEHFLMARQIEEMQDENEQAKYWKSVAGIYISMIQVNVEQDTFNQIRFNRYIEAVIQSRHENFSAEISRIMKATADDDYMEGILQFVNPATLQERLNDEQTITYEYLDKNYGWCRARYIAVNTQPGEKLKQVMFLLESINEQKKREKMLTTIAETDGMTGLFNRRAGIPKIKKLLGTETPGVLCLLDVDKFKSINDNYGHQAGDRVIIAVADVLKETFRDIDVVIRLGGDEFLFFISGVSTEQIGSTVFSRLFRNFEKVSIDSIPDYKISVSIGAAFAKPGLSFDDLYSKADGCTYESKKKEGKAYTFFKA